MNQALPFENNYFDHIVSINSIYATQNPKAVLKEFYRKLKSGGSLYLVNPVKKPSISAVLSEHITLISEHKGFAKSALILRNILKFPQFVLVMIVNLMILKLSKNSVFHFYDIGEFEALVEECGFKLSHTQTIYGDTDIFIIAKKKL
jgi:ubiquinone/menaquinone biosynthesis C-methylase UbiE